MNHQATGATRPMQQPDSACHSSSALEKVLEHVFIGELMSELWRRGLTDIEVLRSEVDSHGYDLVVEASGVIRHIQLKALRKGGKRDRVTLSTRLAGKPSGCVVWMVYHPGTLQLGPFLWFGQRPGKKLDGLGDTIARHSKANTLGEKTLRQGHRVIRKSAFKEIGDMASLADVLFGARNPAKAVAAVAGVTAGASRTGAGTHAG
jgi:hypothetical protein